MGSKGGGGGGQQAAAQDWANTQQGWERSTQANRPTINTPWGKQTWEQNGDQWTQNIALSPEEQASLDSQRRVTQGRSQAAEGLVDQATDAFQRPFDWAGAPERGTMEGMDPQGARNRAEKAIFDRNMTMIEPMLTRSEDARRTRLANMGIAPEGGSAGWERAQQSMDSARQKAYQDASYQAIIGGGAEATREQNMGVQGAQEADRQRQAYIAEEAQRRGMPLNELNALLTGQQVNMPGGLQQNVGGTAGQMGGSNFLGGAQLDSQNAGGFWGGVGSLAGTAAKLYAMK